ncbi:MAG TPA: 2-amino-4-hydroxy-6-hydroxymethyldihydropteridine diphosphokinase [Chloroflexia bacterium]|nr:2-amino-4-hydroxy-6-hydroxymethyldihydropteridine diphosphokinase [Chloroflexia bacterium]
MSKTAGTHHVYLALGSNLGDRQANLHTAVRLLQLNEQVKVRQLSSLYETEPVGYADQPRFLNMCLQASTELEPLALLDFLKSIETEMGRQPTFRNGPRPIDLDIIFYDKLVFENERLQIPHPRLRGRGFVLTPLAELTPGYVHPGLGLTVSELLAEVDLHKAGVELSGPPLDLQNS